MQPLIASPVVTEAVSLIPAKLGVNGELLSIEFHSDANAMADPSNPILFGPSLMPNQNASEITTDTSEWSPVNSAVLTRRDFAAAPNIAPTGGDDEYGIEVKINGAANGYALITIAGLAAGGYFWVKCRGYSPSGNTAVNATRLVVFEGDFSDIIGIDNVSAEDGWETLEVKGISALTSIKIGLQCVSAVNNDIAYFDFIHFYEQNAGEANSTSGWTQLGLGAGANVFESQNTVKAEGSYSIHCSANPTPTANARIYKDIGGDWPLVTGLLYKERFEWRHHNAGGAWQASLDSNNGMPPPTEVISNISNLQTSFVPVPHYFIHSANTKYMVFREGNEADNGGVFIDNLSIRTCLDHER